MQLVMLVAKLSRWCVHYHIVGAMRTIKHLVVAFKCGALSGIRRGIFSIMGLAIRSLHGKYDDGT